MKVKEGLEGKWAANMEDPQVIAGILSSYVAFWDDERDARKKAKLKISVAALIDRLKEVMVL